jgi:Na+-translocating ferredoxin:NAD+ oxidoreductase RnfG subunit
LSSSVFSAAARALATGLLAAGIAVAPPAGARVYASKAQALREAFPEAERIDARSVVLSEEQVREVEARARAPVETKLVTLHTAYLGERVLGHAVIDVHTVRTLPEAFLVVITPQGSVRSVRMLAFHEPEEYLPSARWLRQFEGRSLSEDLRLRRGIHGIAGSTLSARAVSAGVRRALALYAVLIEKEK